MSRFDPRAINTGFVVDKVAAQFSHVIYSTTDPYSYSFTRLLTAWLKKQQTKKLHDEGISPALYWTPVHSIISLVPG